jgi:CBS domain-containing protein
LQTVDQLLRAKGHQIFSIEPTESVLRAIEIMATRHIGALLVMSQGSLIGIISERDYARKLVLKKRSSHDTPVGDIMISPPLR